MKNRLLLFIAALLIFSSCSQENNVVEEGVENEKISIRDDGDISFQQDRLVFTSMESFGENISEFYESESAEASNQELKEMFPQFESFKEYIESISDDEIEEIIVGQNVNLINKIFHLLPDTDEEGSLEAHEVVEGSLAYLVGKSRSIQIADIVYHYYDNKVYFIPEGDYNEDIILEESVLDYLNQFEKEDLIFDVIEEIGNSRLCGGRELCASVYDNNRRLRGQILSANYNVYSELRVTSKNQKRIGIAPFRIWVRGPKVDEIGILGQLSVERCGNGNLGSAWIDEEENNESIATDVIDRVIGINVNWEVRAFTRTEHWLVREQTNGDITQCEIQVP